MERRERKLEDGSRKAETGWRKPKVRGWRIEKVGWKAYNLTKGSMEIVTRGGVWPK
jgi:hypothetical protein